MTPLWATIGRVSSACSNARFTQRSRTVLFHDGSCWARNRGRCRCAPAARPRCIGRPARCARTTARSTGDGRAVDCFAGLAHGLARGSGGRSPTAAGSPATAACRARRRRRTARAGDVAVHSEQVEPGLAASSTSRRSSSAVGVAQARAASGEVGALHEHPLAVDRADPVLQRDLAQPGARDSAVADHAVDEDLDVDVGQRLVAERPRPPQLRLVDVEVPVDLVDASGERLLGLADDRRRRRSCTPATVRAPSLSSRACEPQVGAGVVDVAAQHPAGGRADRPGVVDPHRPPQPAGVPVGSSGVPVLEHPGDVAPAAVALSAGSDLDGQHVLVARRDRR